MMQTTTNWVRMTIGAVCVLLSLVFTGCGGGGGNDDPTGSGILTGIWRGTLTDTWNVPRRSFVETLILSHEGSVVTGYQESSSTEKQRSLDGTYDTSSRTLHIDIHDTFAGQPYDIQNDYTLDVSGNVLLTSKGHEWQGKLNRQ